MSSSPAITLHGAAGEVTGSCILIECAAGRVLVDFGLFQGAVAEEWRNADPPEIDFHSIDAIVVTHAHVDHCGRMGMLPKLGFRGAVICSEPTARLLPRVLRGSASLQATRLREFREGTAPVARVIEPAPDPHIVERLIRRLEPPVLYNHGDAESISSRIEPLAYGDWREIRAGLRVRLHDASHILGSASVEIECAGNGASPVRRILCTGDLGPATQSVLRARPSPPAVDVVVMECTNGARRFGPIAEIEETLGAVLDRVAASQSRVLMPTFSIGRAQQLVRRLARLRARGRLHGLPVYLDSPMAVFASELHQKFPECLAEPLRHEVVQGGAPLHFDELRYLYSRRQSLKVMQQARACVILAGSGFCDAGPILHHLADAIEDPNTEVVLAGHQIEGTLGHGLAGDARLVQINDETLRVNARRTRLEGISGHADQTDLIAWLEAMPKRPELVILNHGTEKARAVFAPLASAATNARVESPALGNRILF